MSELQNPTPGDRGISATRRLELGSKAFHDRHLMWTRQSARRVERVLPMPESVILRTAGDIVIDSSMRVLIAGRENARLVALSGYLTFRGFVVDHAPDVSDARALLEHIHYRALVAGIELGSTEHSSLTELLRQAKAAPEGPRTVALVHSPSSSTEPWPEADLIVGAELPMLHIASVVCASLAG